MLKNRQSNTKISRIVQRSNQFVVFGPGVHHGGFTVSYKIAQVITLADFSWADTEKLTADKVEVQHSLLQCTLQVDIVLWQEAISLFDVKNNGQFDRNKNYCENQVLALHGSLSTFFRKARKNLLFVENDSVHWSNLTSENPASFSAKCCDCERETYSYMKLFKECMQQTATICINHSKASRKVCAVSSHTWTILRRFERGRTEMI